jgi:hypothetical protein
VPPAGEGPTGGVRLIVVDAANVVGSVPDGWWRDRPGATLRLRDALAAGGFRAAMPEWARDAEVVLVVEGVARSVPAVDGVQVVAADGSGDDAIVDVVRHAGSCLVVTADRGLRARVEALGAEMIGPRTVRATY